MTAAEARRNRATETPSTRKNRELLERAQRVANYVEPLPGTRRFYLTGSTCSACANWPLCLPFLGAAHATVNYCARPSLGFRRSYQPTKAEERQALADAG